MLNRLKFQGFFHFNIFWELSLIILLFSWMSHPDQLHYVARPPVLLDIELTLISHRIKWTGWHGPVNCRHYQKPHKMKMFTKMLNKLSFIHWCGSAGYDTDPDPWFALGAIWIKITAAAKILILAFSWIFSFRFSRNFSLFLCKCCNKQILKKFKFSGFR